MRRLIDLELDLMKSPFHSKSKVNTNAQFVHCYRCGYANLTGAKSGNSGHQARPVSGLLPPTRTDPLGAAGGQYLSGLGPDTY